MPASTGVRGAVTEVVRRISAVTRLQAELTKAELSATGKNTAAGAGIAIGAAFIGVFAFGLLTALIVIAIDIALPLWLSVLIVFVLYVIIAAILIAVARDRFSQPKGAPLASEQARLTMSAIGLNREGQDGAGGDAGKV